MTGEAELVLSCARTTPRAAQTKLTWLPAFVRVERNAATVSSLLRYTRSAHMAARRNAIFIATCFFWLFLAIFLCVQLREARTHTSEATTASRRAASTPPQQQLRRRRSRFLLQLPKSPPLSPQRRQR